MSRKTLLIIIGLLGLIGTAFLSLVCFKYFAVSLIPGWRTPILSPYQSIVFVGLTILAITFLLIFLYGVRAPRVT